MNCGQCVHYQKTELKNWGYCVAQTPGWVDDIDTNSSCSVNVVWVTQGHPRNYADRCDLFVEAGDMHKFKEANLYEKAF